MEKELKIKVIIEAHDKKGNINISSGLADSKNNSQIKFDKLISIKED